MRIFGNGATVTISAIGTSNAAITATMTDNSVVLPVDWQNAAVWPLGSIFSANTAAVDVTVTATALGASGSQTVNLSASGPNAANATITRNGQDLKVTWNAINCDTTAPVITPTVTGTPGNNGWYTSDVTVTWTVTDNESTSPRRAAAVRRPSPLTPRARH